MDRVISPRAPYIMSGTDLEDCATTSVGDRITTIAGQQITGGSDGVRAVTALLEGAPGSEVHLTMVSRFGQQVGIEEGSGVVGGFVRDCGCVRLVSGGLWSVLYRGGSLVGGVGEGHS
eukprot:2498430-Rhodomonas_salina.2